MKENEVLNGEQLLSSRELRDKVSNRVDVLDEIKKMILIPQQKLSTVKQVSEYYEVSEDVIVSIYRRNSEELDNSGVVIKSYKDFLNCQYDNLETSKGKVTFVYHNGEVLSVPNRGLRVYPPEAILKVGMLLTDSSVAEKLRTKLAKMAIQVSISGGYVEKNKEQEFINNYFSSFGEDTKKSMVQDLLKSNAEYKQKIAEQEPIIQAYKDLMTAHGYLQFLDVSAMVEIGRTKLMEFLRNKKVLTKQSYYNVPYGRFATNGMFKVITEENEKTKHISSVTMVSPKGLNYIYKLIKKHICWMSLTLLNYWRCVMLIKTEAIIIPQMFSHSKPRQSKIKKHYDYYNKYNRLMKKIVIDSSYQIIDGYIDYLIAVENNMSMIECLIVTDGYISKNPSEKKKIRDILMQKTNGKCSICGCKLHTSYHMDKKYFATIDHIIPLSKDGEDCIENMQIACSHCNQIKSDLLPSSFAFISRLQEVSTNA